MKKLFRLLLLYKKSGSGIIVEPPAQPVVNAILLEDGTNLLLEDGTNLLLEGA